MGNSLGWKLNAAPIFQVNFEITLLLLFTATDKRLIAETEMRKKRSEEEIELLKRDMRSYLTFYRKKIVDLETKEVLLLLLIS